MNETPASQLIALRLEQANETIAEARALKEQGYFRGAINRSYYSMFYAVLALTVLKQKSLSKHSAVIAFFDREFVRMGIFDRDLSRRLHFSFERRQTKDYGETFAIAVEEAEEAISDATVFVQAISNYLASQSS